MRDYEGTNAVPVGAGKPAVDRVDLFLAVGELDKRLRIARNRLESLNGRVNGFGPASDEGSQTPQPSSLRDRLACIHPVLTDIEHFLERLETGIGGELPKATSALR